MRRLSVWLLLTFVLLLAFSAICTADGGPTKEDDIDAEVEVEPNDIAEVEDPDEDDDDGSDGRQFQSSPDADISVLFTKPLMTVEDPIGNILPQFRDTSAREEYGVTS